jgi:hypothetical protein
MLREKIVLEALTNYTDSLPSNQQSCVSNQAMDELLEAVTLKSETTFLA